MPQRQAPAVPPFPARPVRTPAAHVQAALARAAQGKPSPPVVRPPAPHVAAALAAVQGRPVPGAGPPPAIRPGARPPGSFAQAQPAARAAPAGRTVLQRMEASPQTWFQATGHEKRDLRALARLLQERSRGDEQLEDHFSCTKIEGLRACYRQELYKSMTLAEFLAACDKQTDWVRDTKALEDYLEDDRAWQDLKGHARALPQIGSIPLSHQNQATAFAVLGFPEIGQGGNHIEYDQVFVVKDQGIWTDHMGPCITVGLTATCDGHRYNAIVHSMNLDLRGDKLVAGLQGTFDGQRLPRYSDLQNVEFFAVGGSVDTKKKALSIVDEFRRQGLRVMGLGLTLSKAQRQLTKAVFVSKGGKVKMSVR